MFIFRWLLYLFLFSVLAVFAIGIAMVSLGLLIAVPLLVLIL